MINLIGKVVYSTKTAGVSAGTMFDAFIHTMSKSNVARQSARRIVNETTELSKGLEKIADDILKHSGADAIVKPRVKGVGSTAAKIQKNFTGFQKDGYDASKEKIYEVILGGGTKELVGDSYGIRFILQSEKKCGRENSLRIYDSILNIQKNNPRTFSLTGFEDYYGRGIKPYGNEAIRNRFAELRYRTSLGKQKETIAAFTDKPSGYTRTNINGCINGVNTEIQVGGVHTTRWGDVEHILYDMRQGKPLDMSKYTPEQKKLAMEIQEAYREVLQRKSGHTAQEFSEKYLNKLWNSFREAEVKNLAEPIYPEFPQGYPDILKVENILKLVHD